MADKQSATISVRFSGNSFSIFTEIQKISQETGLSCNEIIRYLTTIGYEAYKRGAIAGFDGKVVLPEDDENTISHNNAKPSLPKDKSKSTFLD